MTAGRLGASWRASGAVLAQPQLRRAVLAFACAVTAEWAFAVALAVVAFRDGGATGVGLVALVRMVPAALGAPFATAFADRARRERVLAAVSVTRGVTIGCAAVVFAVDAPHLFIYALAVAATVAFTVFRPAHSSLLPSLCITTAELTSANAVRGLLESLATLVGPVIAGALLAWSDAAAVFAVAALLSFVAAVFLLRIRCDAPVRAGPVEHPELIREAVEGLRAVSGNSSLRLLFGLGVAQSYVRGALNVFTVVVAFELLDTGESGVAALSAAVGVGGVLGSLGVSLFVGNRHLGRLMIAALVLWGAPIGIIGARPKAAIAFTLIAVVGLANSIIDIPFFTLPVRLASDAVLARVFGVFESVITVALAAGSVLTPVVIALLGVRVAMIATGMILPAVALLAWRPLVALDHRLAVRDTEIDVLRATPMLQLLPVPSIEYLASRVRSRRVPAGTVVFVQGDPGDSFFVIAEGEADVVGDGAPVRTLGAGDSFGEIALLHDVARTATVRAREDLVMFEIDREAFLDTVAGHSTSNAAAQAVVARHLADFHPAGLAI